MSGTAQPVVVIAGAAGFVGKAVLKRCEDAPFALRALTRTVSETQSKGRESVEWRRCDLFSLLDAESALDGADYGIYLVHSMLASAGLTQGEFQDLDLILADNFARAAKKAGLKQIIYLGGLIPPEEELSLHLRSRLEVEEALASSGVPVTSLRAGLIVGTGGSSFRILTRLVARMPVVLCPELTRSLTQPVSLEDVVESIFFCIGNDNVKNRVCDLGGPDILSYQEMLERTAKVMGLKRLILPVPVFSSRLASRWLRFLTGSPKELVSPLVESLKHEMRVIDGSFLKEINRPFLGFEEALSRALKHENPGVPAMSTLFSKMTSRSIQKNENAQKKRDVRSVQRMPLPAGKDAIWAAQEYIRWLPSFLKTLLRVDLDSEGGCQFRIIGMKKPLLVLRFSQERSVTDRQLFYIRGGLLVDTGFLESRGRLEFREVLNKRFVIAAIHEYFPALPWGIYRVTQAVFHLFVMNAFTYHLELLSQKKRSGKRSGLEREPFVILFWLGCAVVWMGLIALSSAVPHSGQITGEVLGPLNLSVRKLAHVFTFGMLAFFWWQVLRPGKRAYVLSFILSVGYAVTDEWHQHFVPGRFGSAADVGIDAIGVVLALLLCFWWERKKAGVMI